MPMYPLEWIHSKCLIYMCEITLDAYIGQIELPTLCSACKTNPMGVGGGGGDCNYGGSQCQVLAVYNNGTFSISILADACITLAPSKMLNLVIVITDIYIYIYIYCFMQITPYKASEATVV